MPRLHHRFALLLLAVCLAACAGASRLPAGKASEKRARDKTLHPPTDAQLAEMHAFRDRPPVRPDEPIVQASVETEEMMPMPDAFAVAMDEREVLIGSYRGLRAGTHACLRFMRLTKRQLRLIMKTGCMRKAALAGLARTPSRWLVLHDQLTDKGAGTNRYAVSALLDGGTRLQTVAEIDVSPFRSMGPRGPVGLHKDVRLIARRGGSPLLLWTHGSHTRAALLSDDGGIEQTYDLGEGHHQILSATWAGDHWLVLRRSKPVQGYLPTDNSAPLLLTSLAPGGSPATHLLRLGTVRSAELVARSGRASLLYRDDDKGEWLLPLEHAAEAIEIDIHPYQGAFGPSATLGNFTLILQTDSGPRHAYPDRTPQLFSLVDSAGQTIAERVPLDNRRNLHQSALYSDGGQAVVIWKAGDRLDRFGVARLQAPRSGPIVPSTPQQPAAPAQAAQLAR